MTDSPEQVADELQMFLFIGLLLKRLGGSVTFSNKEIEAADLEAILRRDTLDEVTYEIRLTQREPG